VHSKNFFKEIKTFIQQECITFTKSDIYNVTKAVYLFWTFYSSKNPETKLLSTLIIIIDDSWVANQHIRMISNWYDTEDWSNDAENSALHHRNKLHFKIYSNKKPWCAEETIYILSPLKKKKTFCEKKNDPW